MRDKDFSIIFFNGISGNKYEILRRAADEKTNILYGYECIMMEFLFHENCEIKMTNLL